MNPDYALAYFEAIRSCSYITDADLRDAMMKELMFINRALHPGKAKPDLVAAHSTTEPKGGRRAISNSQ